MARTLVFVAAGLAVAAPHASASPDPPAARGDSAESSAPTRPATDTATDGPRPWADGVTEAEQAIARDLYAAGNREFAESRFAQALAKYREAIRHWDHPAIRYNMAVCLINLDQPVEARDELERSLAHGVAALGSEAHAQGLTYRKLLDAQLGQIEIACPEPGAEVALDGKLLFTGPGRARRIVLPGEHRMVATKPGLQTASQTVTLIAGKPASYQIRPMSELTQVAPRWRYWKYLVGGGGALLAAGTVSYLAARDEYRDYDVDFGAQCPHGCTPAQAGMISSLRAKKDAAEILQTAGLAALSLGGAIVVTGVIGLLVDQPRARREPVRAAVIAIPGGAAVSMIGDF